MVSKSVPFVALVQARVAAAAIVGGTASVLGGGKFANGAVTGAFSRLFNDELHFSIRKKEISWVDDNGNVVSSYDGQSGPFGKGALPEGEYMGSNLRLRDTKGMVCDGFGWSLDIEPKFTPDPYRDYLRIHPDQAPTGTLGCIGVACSDSRRLYDDLKNYLPDGHKSIPVIVTP